MTRKWCLRISKAFLHAIIAVIALLACASYAQQPQSAQDDTALEDSQPSPLTTLGGEYHNSIKLLQNRFRIDYQIDEITLVFFREFGSAPVVLVRPDGSKIFSTQADGEKVFWYDANTYDMISIKDPVPGPWQAVGQILPNSRVMVLSDIRLHAEPLPPMIFSGEILKQTAYLTNGEEPINYSEFRDVVELTIELTSTNNPNYNNFGANSEVVATFVDNGLGMDEAPLDGTFTGQFNLAIAAGEWQPVFRVSTPMFTREQIDAPIILHPNPIIIDVALDDAGEGYHKLLIDAKRELVDISSLLIDGKIRFPNGDIQNFSLTELSSNVREHLIVNYGDGVFRVKLTAYGKTANGRDFILDVPEYTFVVQAPPPEPVNSPVESEMNSQTDDGPATLTDNLVSEPIEEDSVDVVFWVLTINGTIIVLGLIGVGAYLWLQQPKKPKVSTATEPNEEEPSDNGNSASVSFLQKLKALLPF